MKVNSSELQRVHADGRTHGAADVQAAHIDALRRGGLRLVDGFHQGSQVLLNLLRAERDLANRAVDDGRLVQTILHLTSLNLGDGLGHIHGDSAGLRVRHQALRAEDTTDAADQTHHIRGSHADIEVEPVFGLDLGDHVLIANVVSASRAGFISLRALSDDQHADRAASAMRQNDRAADLLVSVTGVNAQTNGDLDGLVEFGLAGLANQVASVSRIISSQGINQLYEFDCGKNSGWMYSVNGEYPNYGASSYNLKDGDKVEWRYTCNLGSDVGDKYEGK